MGYERCVPIIKHGVPALSKGGYCTEYGPLSFLPHWPHSMWAGIEVSGRDGAGVRYVNLLA